MITINLEMPDEYQEIISDMGFDVDGFFKNIFQDLGKRYEVKVRENLLTMNQSLIDEEVEGKKKKAKVKK